MAMMMTGRVLLVCALCVLWCGAGCRCEEDAIPSASLFGATAGSVGEGLQESQVLVPEGSHNLGLKAPHVKAKTEGSLEKVLSTEEDESSSEEDDDEDEEEEGVITPSEIKETLPPSPPPGGEVQSQGEKGNLEKVNEIGLQPENQRQVKEGQETVVDVAAEVTKENKGSGPQAQLHETVDKEEDTRNGEGNPLTQGTEQHVNMEEITPRNPAGDHSLGEHKGSDGSKEEEDEEGEGDEDATSERVLAGGQEKRNSTSGPEGVPNKTNTEGTQTTADSDRSTAVSHTTSPLLLLLVFACAAAAAVVAV
ncbi:mucin-associated surface protein (MASP), putative [Trypanosoma cruzi marinkellei]|uniref:Mucin-associated surface protein (MASP), putative n=1 Tax=Trypanosoma cruzi marinkellei TaxID=85056 RepID=K2MX31_TRYCR|nr:mucin-associated surface protein (MASP), putative [Trypanosoma cruzi marinkellei]